MLKVKNLIKILERLPEDTYCYGYEGEDTGIGLCKLIKGKEGEEDVERGIGFISTRYSTSDEIKPIEEYINPNDLLTDEEKRNKIEQIFIDENEDILKREYKTIYSTFGIFDLLIRFYSLGDNHYSRGTVYRYSRFDNNQEEICDIKRNHNQFIYSIVKQKDITWFVSGRSYYGQTIVNLKTKDIFESRDQYHCENFVWEKCTSNQDGTILVVKGFYYNSPSTYKFYDFTDPSKGWVELELDDLYFGFIIEEPVWVDNNTFVCISEEEFYLPLNKFMTQCTLDNFDEEIDEDRLHKEEFIIEVKARTIIKKEDNKLITVLKERLKEEE